MSGAYELFSSLAGQQEISQRHFSRLLNVSPFFRKNSSCSWHIEQETYLYLGYYRWTRYEQWLSAFKRSPVPLDTCRNVMAIRSKVHLHDSTRFPRDCKGQIRGDRQNDYDRHVVDNKFTNCAIPPTGPVQKKTVNVVEFAI